jgi:hypothetical protein
MQHGIEHQPLYGIFNGQIGYPMRQLGFLRVHRRADVENAGNVLRRSAEKRAVQKIAHHGFKDAEREELCSCRLPAHQSANPCASVDQLGDDAAPGPPRGAGHQDWTIG